MNVVKSLVLDWLPPAMARWVRQQRGGGIRFEGEFATWEEAASRCTGYDAKGILDKVLEATLKVKRGEAAFERDSVLFDEIEYSWPLLAGLMWAAARNGGKLNVLDFGGALGSSYFQNRAFLQTLSEVRWSVVEQAHYVEAGIAHIQDEQLRFYKTIEECLSENQPNVILLSSVLQYIENPYDLLNDFSKIKASHFVIDRTPFTSKKNDILTIQYVPASIFSSTLPSWLLSEQKINIALNMLNYVQVADFSSGVVCSDKFEIKGFILERNCL